MKRFGRSLFILALCLPVLAGCGRLAPAGPTAFDELAPRVPGDAEQAYFLDLKPGGDAGRHWQRIREQLEANPTGQEALNAALQPFRVEAYGLQEFVPGPAVSGYRNGVDYVIIPVSDEAPHAPLFICYL